MMALPVKTEAMTGEIRLWNYSSLGLAWGGRSSAGLPDSCYASESCAYIGRRQREGTHFQLTQAATTPKGCHITSCHLYAINRLPGLFSLLRLSSPCLMTHLNFSAVTNISPNIASTIVFPESKQATRAIASWFSSTNFNIVLSTFLRWANVVCAHSVCASVALAIARSMEEVVEGLMRPRDSPVAGA